MIKCIFDGNLLYNSGYVRNRFVVISRCSFYLYPHYPHYFGGFFFHCHALSAYRTHYTEEEPACLPLNFRTNAADFGRVVAIIKLSQYIAVNIAYILVMQLAHFVFEYSDNTWDGYKYRTFLARNEAESLVSLTDSTIEKETSIDEYGSCSVLNL